MILYEFLSILGKNTQKSADHPTLGPPILTPLWVKNLQIFFQMVQKWKLGIYTKFQHDTSITFESDWEKVIGGGFPPPPRAE